MVGLMYWKGLPLDWTCLTLFLLNVALLFVLYSADYDKYSEDPEFKPASRHAKDLFEEVQI